MKRIITSIVGIAAFVVSAVTPVKIPLQERATLDAKGNPYIASVGEKKGDANGAKLPQRDASSDIVTIVEENFSLMTEGSQELEDLIYDENYLGIPGEPYIPDNLTHQPGWSTIYGVEADGAIGLATPIGGAINTPEGDYSGKLTISFRMKALTGNANLLVNLCGNGIYDVYGLLDMDIVRVNEDTEDPLEWHEYSVSFDNEVSNNSSFIQFNAMYCQVLLDDIKVTSDYSGFLPAPTALDATDFSLDGFKANWTEVRIADKYLFSAYSRTQSGPEQEYAYDFEDGQVPAGWVIDPELSISDDKGLDNSAAIIVNKDCVIESPYYQNKIKSYEIWFRRLSEQSYFSMMHVEGYDGYKWISLGDMPISSMPMDEEGGVLYLDGSVRPSFHDAYFKLRFSFEGWEEEAEYGLTPEVAIDDIYVETMPSFEKHYVVENETTEHNFKKMDGLDPYTDYFYQVASVRGDLQSWSAPVLAFGITTPIVSDPSCITENSYQANWIPTPKATAYHVRDFSVFEANEDMESYPVLEENFTPAYDYDETLEDPFMLGNYYQYVYLNEFCENPGWNGASTLVADGMVGSGYGAYQGIRTPELTLDNGSGEFDVDVTIYVESYGYGDAVIITPSSATGEYIGFEAEDGFNTVSLHYYDGSSSESLYFTTQNGSAFYLANVMVTQDISAGDKIYSYRHSKLVNGGENTEYVFDDIDFSEEPVHAYDVMAILEQDYKECTSSYSSHSFVSSGSVVVKPEVKVADVLINSIEGGIEVIAGKEEKAAIATLTGNLVKSVQFKSGSNMVSLESGIYLLIMNNATYKVLVK